MHEVYLAYDQKMRLLYVGACKNIEKRWEGHQSTSLWSSYCAKLVVQKYPTKSFAMAVEARAIRLLGPKFNSQHNRKPRDPRAYLKRAKLAPRGKPETVRRWRREGFPGLHTKEQSE